MDWGGDHGGGCCLTDRASTQPAWYCSAHPVANSHLRCRQCRSYFPRDQAVRGNYCSVDCVKLKLAESKNKSIGALKKKSKRIHPALQRLVRERDGHRCRICCGTYLLASHHIIFRSQWPKSNGTPDLEWNLITLCGPCHIHRAHGQPQRYGPLLKATMWLEYFHGVRLLVPQVERWLKENDGHEDSSDAQASA